jgi:phosphoglycerate kinase
MSHLNDPKEKTLTDSLSPVALKLGELIGQNVPLATDCIGDIVQRNVESMRPGSVLLLENLRFNPGEKKNDPTFSHQLASFGEVFVSDAFATAHREHASIVGVPQIFIKRGDPAVAGFLMEKEINAFERALLSPERPLCVVLGGAKVSSKLTALINIAEKADVLIIGGAMANTFLAAQGYQMGASLYEPDKVEIAASLLNSLRERGCSVHLPADLVVAERFSEDTPYQVVPAQKVPDGMMALDIGPDTCKDYGAAVRKAGTILWNGPMGAFEMLPFSAGTQAMMSAIGGSDGYSVVGGGDTDAAIHSAGKVSSFDYISTGGGAFLALLEGKVLPGIKALQEA